MKYNNTEILFNKKELEPYNFKDLNGREFEFTVHESKGYKKYAILSGKEIDKYGIYVIGHQIYT